jgi:hypothetical protein
MASYKYPKLTILLVSFSLAYIFFFYQDYSALRTQVAELGWIGLFIAGMMYAYGFTAAIGTAALLVMAKDYPILAAGLVAGVGSLFADVVIFKLIRTEFMDEIRHLSNEKAIVRSRVWIWENLHVRVKAYLMPFIGAVIIASPLPDELGVSLLAASSRISPGFFALTAYTLNTVGILSILYVGSFL